jgi:type IV pilus assembly protein PilB
MRKRLGDYLVQSGIIDSKTLAKALDIQKVQKKRLGRILRDMGAVDDEMIASALASQLDVPLLHLSELQIPADIIALVPHELAEKHTLIPVRKTQRELLVAMGNPVDVHASDDLNFVTGLTIKIGVASERDIRRAIVRYYKKSNKDGDLSSLALENLETELATKPARNGPAFGLSSLGGSSEGLQIVSQAQAEPDSDEKDTGALLDLAENPPIVRFSNAILTDAINLRASDVHIEPQDAGVLVRYRVDGIMREMARIDKSLHAPLVSRIKVLANLDISERRKPQDGRYHIRFNERDYDLRVSTIPTLYGEKVALRILDQGGVTRDFKDLGLSDEDLARFEYAVSLPQGIILLTGPTGSGKSSTIYTMLGRLNSPTVNIVTIEDPVEYKMRGLNQMQINPKAGITFATGLRAILRQDPDIVMPGEIRDSETAAIALQAAQTGHLVLSSLHTNDAPSAVIRLMDLGVPAFLISSSLIMVVSQRLLRRICRECKALDPQSSEILRKLPAYAVESRQAVLWKGTGCNACQHTGYSGRLGIFEVLMINSSLRDIIVEGVSASTLKIAAEAEGFKPMALDGIEKAFQGLTTIEEVLRVAPPEPDIVRHLFSAGLAAETSGQDEPPLEIPILPRESAGPKRILVVEDSEVTLRVLRSILEAEGYLVVTARDGVEAMNLVLEGKPDLIITDFLMPNMDGYTLIKKLQSQPATRDIPIMMLTQKDEIDSELEVLASGASDYLVKPVNPRRLVGRVRRLLFRHSAVD